ncbi:MAG: type IV pilus biogenesis/stability protein PilW [Thiobacillaceae bacterium]
MQRWTVACVAIGVSLAACQNVPSAGQGGSSPASEGTQPVSQATQRAKIFTDLGAAYFQRGQFKVALDEVRKAIASDSDYGPAYDILGLIYMDLTEDELAEENFHKAVELDHSDSAAHNNYGWFLCSRGRYDEGLSQFTAALRNPLYATPEEALVNAGRCNEQKGDMQKAEASFIKAMKLQPDYPLALISMARLKFKQDNLAEADRFLVRYHSVATATPESLWLGVRIERKLGNKDQETAYATQLHKGFPDSREDSQLMSGQY